MGWKNPPWRPPGRSDTPYMPTERVVDKQQADADRIARRMLDYGEPRPGAADGGGATASNRPSTAERQPAPRLTVRLAVSAWWTIAIARLVLLLSPSSRAERAAVDSPESPLAARESSASRAGLADARAGFTVHAGVDTTGP
jgi:hypothetical protein